MNLTKFARLLGMWVSLLTMGGCATTAEFNNTPQDISEFSKDMSYLESHYSDIDKYDRTFAPPTDAPSVQTLEGIWGKPDKKETRWGRFMVGVGLSLGFVSTGYLSYPFLAIVYIMHPYPQKTYMWTKGNYQVTAIGRSELLTRYEERIHRWEWEKIEGGEKLAPNNN